MAPFPVYLLASLVYVGIVRGVDNPKGGTASCPCLSKQALLGGDSFCNYDIRTVSGDCYDDSFGWGECKPHDLSITKACVNFDPMPKWCENSFCWVDPANCDRPNHPSSENYFSGAKLSDGTPLTYSYQTCGSLDYYSENEFEDILKEKLKKVRITFPGASSSQYTIVRSEGYSGFAVNESPAVTMSRSGREGSIPDFMNTILVRYGVGEIETVEVSPKSQEFSSSSFTACTHEVAIGNADICVGNIWPTVERRLLTSFTSPIYNDEFHLITKKVDTQDGASFSPSDIIKPFGLWCKAPQGRSQSDCFKHNVHSWVWIFAVLVFAAFSIWMTEGWTNETEFPERAFSDQFARATFNMSQGFFGGGDHRHVPHTASGRITITSFSLAVLVLLTTYTAEMTSKKVEEVQATGIISSLNQALDEDFKVCGMNAALPAFVPNYPKISSLYVGTDSAKKSLQNMDDGLCEVAIVTADEWQLLQREASNCDKHRQDEVLRVLPNAFAVSAELQAPLSWAITREQDTGVYAEIRTKSQAKYYSFVDDVCARKAAVEAPLKLSNVMGPCLISIIGSAIGIVIYLFRYSCIAHKDELPEGLSEAGQDLLLAQMDPGPVRRATTTSGSVGSQKTQVVAGGSTDGTSNDRDSRVNVGLIARMIRARHAAMSSTHSLFKADAKLTLADVPELVSLITASLQGRSIEMRDLADVPSHKESADDESAKA